MSPDRRPDNSSTNSPRRAVLALAAMVAGATLVGCSSGSTPEVAETTTTTAVKAPTESLLIDISGSGDQDTETFTASTGWELRWELEGEHLTVELLTDGEPTETILDREGTGGGSTYPAQDGTFSLRISGTGTWHVRVFDHG